MKRKHVKLILNGQIAFRIFQIAVRGRGKFPSGRRGLRNFARGSFFTRWWKPEAE